MERLYTFVQIHFDSVKPFVDPSHFDMKVIPENSLKMIFHTGCSKNYRSITSFKSGEPDSQTIPTMIKKLRINIEKFYADSRFPDHDCTCS